MSVTTMRKSRARQQLLAKFEHLPDEIEHFLSGINWTETKTGDAIMQFCREHPTIPEPEPTTPTPEPELEPQQPEPEPQQPEPEPEPEQPEPLFDFQILMDRVFNLERAEKRRGRENLRKQVQEMFKPEPEPEKPEPEPETLNLWVVAAWVIVGLVILVFLARAFMQRSVNTIQDSVIFPSIAPNFSTGTYASEVQ